METNKGLFGPPLEPMPINNGFDFSKLKADIKLRTNDWLSPKIFTIIPDEDVFSDFNRFIDLLTDLELWRSGIVKIIPPPSFHLTEEDFNFNNVEISSFTKQNMVKSHSVLKSKPKKSKNSSKRSKLEETVLIAQVKERQQCFSETENKTVGYFREIIKKDLIQNGLPENWTGTDLNAAFDEFWKVFTSETVLCYGKDNPLSIDFVTPEKFSSWNLSKLETLLNDCGLINAKGITTPYLYLGALFTFFIMHVEDQQTFSINYQHFGSGKFWLAIGSPDAHKVIDNCSSELRKIGYDYCDHFLRMKSTFANPAYLHDIGVKFDGILQEEGEIVVTFPNGFHCGFNLGFNINSSVNFATSFWLEYMLFADVCNCREVDLDTVYINPRQVAKKHFQLDPTFDYELYVRGSLLRVRPETLGEGTRSLHRVPCGIFGNLEATLDAIKQYTTDGHLITPYGSNLTLACRELDMYLKDAPFLLPEFLKNDGIELMKLLLEETFVDMNIIPHVLEICNLIFTHYPVDQIKEIDGICEFLEDYVKFMDKKLSFELQMLINWNIAKLVHRDCVKLIHSTFKYENNQLRRKVYDKFMQLGTNLPLSNVVITDFDIIVEFLLDEDNYEDQFCASRVLHLMIAYKEDSTVAYELKSYPDLVEKMVIVAASSKIQDPARHLLRESLQEYRKKTGSRINFEWENCDKPNKNCLTPIVSSPVQYFDCIYCWMTSKDEESADKHLDSYHPQCESCEKYFATDQGLVRHSKTGCATLRKRERLGRNEFKCSQCELSYSRESNRTRHFKQVHQGGIEI